MALPHGVVCALKMAPKSGRIEQRACRTTLRELCLERLDRGAVLREGERKPFIVDQ